MNKALQGKLTILMPTYGRSVFVDKILGYYSSQKLSHKIVLIDSSPKLKKEKIYESFNKYRNQLNVEFIDHVRENDLENLALVRNEYWLKLINYIDKVETPYVLCCGDDDFFTTKAIDKILQVLDSDTSKEISCATGHCFDFWCSINDADQIELGKNGFTRARSTMNFSNPIDRLIHKSYPNVVMGECHSILRKEVLSKILFNMNESKLWEGDRMMIFAEQYWNIYANTAGKCYVCDELYWIKPRIRKSLPTSKEKDKDVYNCYLYSHIGQEGYIKKYKETLDLYIKQAKEFGLSSEHAQYTYETWFMGIYEMRLTRTRKLLLKEFPPEVENIEVEQYGIKESAKYLMDSIINRVTRILGKKEELSEPPKRINLESPLCPYRKELKDIFSIIEN